MLVALHDLDIIRKHRRLLKAQATPQTIAVFPDMIREGFQFVSVWPGLENDAIIAVTGADALDRDILLTLTVTIAEADPVGGKAIVTTLRDFASRANSIINLFDAP